MLLLLTNIALAVTSSASFTVYGIVPAIIRVSSSNRAITVLHNIPIDVPSNCNIISNTEYRCSSNITITTVE